MNSALGAVVGLAVAIVLIVRRFSPVYSLLLGAVVGGLMGGMGLDATVANMISGVKDITPAIIRIIGRAYQDGCGGIYLAHDRQSSGRATRLFGIGVGDDAANGRRSIY